MRALEQGIKSLLDSGFESQKTKSKELDEGVPHSENSVYKKYIEANSCIKPTSNHIVSNDLFKANQV